MYPKVVPQALAQSMASAEDLRRFCATTSSMNSYQPIAASAVEACAALASSKTHKADKFAAYIVDRTALLINTMSHVQISPEIIKSLGMFEQKLDAIRRHIEQMPVQSGKKAKLLLGYKFKRETRRLKAELENHLYDLISMGSACSPSRSTSRSECVLELISLTTRAAGAICEAPVLNFLKPVVGIAALICDTAKCVKSNHDDATELAKHASMVTKCIVDRASSMDPATTANNVGALETLKLALEDIQAYLTFLGKPRRRLAPWIFATREKDRFVQLNAALDKALAMFSSTKILSTAEDVRATTAQIDIVLSTVERLDSDINRTLTIIHADLNKLSVAASAQNPGCVWADNSFLASPQPFFFLDEEALVLVLFSALTADRSLGGDFI
ncbi:hypothetical protein FB451DRAFT_243057 [Mycena latifolia]|nr:hypothetical protein FB451DRAFT_243057 [Mycena latifolia]